MKQGGGFSSQEGLCLKEMETRGENKDRNSESAARETPMCITHQVSAFSSLHKTQVFHQRISNGAKTSRMELGIFYLCLDNWIPQDSPHKNVSDKVCL